LIADRRFETKLPDTIQLPAALTAFISYLGRECPCERYSYQSTLINCFRSEATITRFNISRRITQLAIYL